MTAAGPLRPSDASAESHPPASADTNRMRMILREAVSEVSHLSPLQVVRRADCVEEVLCELNVDGTHYVLARMQSRPRTCRLSPREREIAALVAQGLPTKAIGVALGISSWTVATHLRRIYARLEVRSRAAMVARLLDEGLI